jgi:chromosomal replication initiation ATPase DnaA
MAKKKFWKGILGHKEGEKPTDKSTKPTDASTDEIQESDFGPDLLVEEMPKDTCRLCYEKFKVNTDAYKCGKCNTFYHYPKCLKNQTSCRVCGEKIVELGNVAKLIRFKNVVCPKCGMKIKLYYGKESKLHVNCPSCGREGFIPNPYLKTLGSEDDEEAETTESEEEEEEETEEEEIEFEEGEEEDETEEVSSDAESEEMDIDLAEEPEADDTAGPSIIKPSQAKKRKAKLVVLDESKTCNVCLGAIKTGLNVVVCRCGKYYHDSCADRVKLCPICDADFSDIENLVDDTEIDLSDEDLAAFSESEPEPEPEPEPELELELKLNEHNTFEEYDVNDNNKIILSIAQGIAEMPGKEYNLIYIFGPKELGKTHLIQAIGNQIANSDSELVVRYATISQFYSELEYAEEIKKVDDFNEYYNGSDIFLIDDLQEIPKKKKNQEILMKILDNLLENNKQLVITGDRALDEIKDLNKDIMKKIYAKCGLIVNLFESGIGSK